MTIIYAFASLLIGFITTVFVMLKLFGAIGWAWIWVFAPVWISWAILIAAFVVFTTFYYISDTIKERKTQRSA